MATASEATRSIAGSEIAVSTAVVESVSAATDTPMLELPPLQDAIDPDALDALFTGRTTTASVRCRYAGCVVTITADRTIEVTSAT